MLAIRFQRVGRKGHAEFRVVVQESRRSPSSGSIVAQIGHYNPHSKVTVLDKEKASFYVGNGAQPSPRVAKLMKREGVKLPDWVKIDTGMKSVIKNTDKLRRNRPAGAPEAEPKAEVVEEAPVAEVEAPAAEEIVETTEAPAEEVPAETPKAEATATEEATEPTKPETTA